VCRKSMTEADVLLLLLLLLLQLLWGLLGSSWVL
jgi:hypothetical protein